MEKMHNGLAGRYYWELAEMLLGEVEFRVYVDGPEYKAGDVFDLDDHYEYDAALDKYHNVMVESVSAEDGRLILMVF